jgi:hypothetical protein
MLLMLLGEYLMTLGAHLLVCQMSPKQVWSWRLVAWEPSCFLSVTWCGEALYRLGVQGFGVLFLFIYFFFCQVWLQQESILFGLLKDS